MTDQKAFAGGGVVNVNRYPLRAVEQLALGIFVGQRVERFDLVVAPPTGHRADRA